MSWLARAAIGVGVAGLAVAASRYLIGRRTITRHVTDYAIHWGDRTREHPADVLHYVALGDSAAQGVGASAVDNGYVAILGRRLAQATGRSVVVTNLSISGAVTDDVVAEQLEEFRSLPFTPDLVTLDIGANDVIFKKDPVGEFPERFRTILEALPDGSFVGDVPWMVLPGWSGQSAVMAAEAAKLAAEHGHHVVELHHPGRSVGLVRHARRTARDWFHPNDDGYLAWADAFWARIEASGVLEDLRAPRH